MAVYFSEQGNLEVWDEKPAGYLTPEEWAELHPPPAVALEDARALKIARIDGETEAAIVAGFHFTVDGKELHFSYGPTDQQNFADTANAAMLLKMGVPGIPSEIAWNGWRIGADGTRSLNRLTLGVDGFLTLYMTGALAHKEACRETGAIRKAAVAAAGTLEEVEAV